VLVVFTVNLLSSLSVSQQFNTRVVVVVCRCSDGGPQTPAHHCTDFSFKTYAPVAFQYFRELFDIRSEDYMVRLSAACMLLCYMLPCELL